MSIDALLKNPSTLPVRLSKNLTTAFYSTTTKPEIFFYETKTLEKAKRTRQADVFKNYAHTYNVEVLDSFNLELQLKKH